MARRMSRLLALLIGMSILLSLGAGSIAHAAESISCTADSIVNDHSDVAPEPSGDQGPDKATQHAHGTCHGHHVATAGGEAALATSLPPRSLHELRDQALAREDIFARDLRPPIA